MPHAEKWQKIFGVSTTTAIPAALQYHSTRCVIVWVVLQSSYMCILFPAGISVAE